jgi:hypothetical protein
VSGGKTPIDPLAYVFAELWEAFTDGSLDIDGPDIERIIETTGLATWDIATREDVKNTFAEIEEGDAILRLTAEGRAVVSKGRQMK